MWYCEIIFTSGRTEYVPFKNQRKAEEFCNTLCTEKETNTFLKVDFLDTLINLKNIEVIKKPRKIESEGREL